MEDDGLLLAVINIGFTRAMIIIVICIEIFSTDMKVLLLESVSISIIYIEITGIDIQVVLLAH